MAPGGPGASSRGRGGKFKKYTRGGGKHFSRDLRPLDAEGNEVSMWSADAKHKKEGSGDDDSEGDSEEESESESDDDDAAAGTSAAAAELSREERKKEKKARKEAALARARAQAVQVGDLPPSDEDSDEDSEDMPANPNHSRAARNQAKAPVAAPQVDEAAEGVKALKVSGTPSRRERESMEAAQAKERYRKLHEAGKTDEAKADLARLALIREKREAEAARKQAEKEDREAQEAAKKKEMDAKEAKRREAAMGPAAKAKKGKK